MPDCRIQDGSRADLYLDARCSPLCKLGSMHLWYPGAAVIRFTCGDWEDLPHDTELAANSHAILVHPSLWTRLVGVSLPLAAEVKFRKLAPRVAPTEPLPLPPPVQAEPTLVPCTVSEVDLVNEHGRSIPGVMAVCSRCSLDTESFGRGAASRTRCLVLMREGCPKGQSNFYVEGRVEYAG